MNERLNKGWFARPTLTVAKDLLGCVLVHKTPRGAISGTIVEVEAYCGVTDRACHTYGGRRSKRNDVMFGEAGHAYIYLIYGMYNCFNITSDTDDHPCAILIRALRPLSGIDLMRANSPKIRKENELCMGPGRLCRAMAITRKEYGLPLFDPASRLYVTGGDNVQKFQIVKSKRIGIDYAGKDAERLWRFSIKDDRCVSHAPA